MKVTVAVDSFKGSLTTFQIAKAIGEGIKRVYADAEIFTCPMADGGEGTAEAVTGALGGQMTSVTVTGPLGKPVTAQYGYVKEKGLAVVEMSSAAGITLVTEQERNPLFTTTYGVGEIILDAISKGCRSFLVGIGGSATNDGGAGMLQALGFELVDKDGNSIARGARGLENLAQIKTEKACAELKECTFKVACDVKNPLCGDNGCSKVFAPQKGADEEMIKNMDKWLLSYASKVKEVFPRADENCEGAGAAGGMGFALMSFLGARLVSGVELVMKETGLEEYIKKSDIVVTGEGRLDGQTAMGKAPSGVASLAKKHSRPVIAFSGAVTDEAVKCNQHGIDAFFPILRKVCTLDEAMDIDNAYKNGADTAEQVFRLVRCFGIK